MMKTSVNLIYLFIQAKRALSLFLSLSSFFPQFKFHYSWCDADDDDQADAFFFLLTIMMCSTVWHYRVWDRGKSSSVQKRKFDLVYKIEFFLPCQKEEQKSDDSFAFLFYLSSLLWFF